MPSIADRGASFWRIGLPPYPAAPALQAGAVDPGGLVVVKLVLDPVTVQPGARLLHGVAVLDAVENRHGMRPGAARSAAPMTSTTRRR